ncbi:MAG: 16S rRNA (uracil(1498)-N(3))-methyltransferase [Verrucomicrobiae bacterium]|nr:16S rRNA (uracil(1498)-N(3))-methyltransferase [Verrucomicrobiae bacterium]NNJ44122.1 16S rRNA (uracil(1498)-N(3))-methyltransferase [Akkermansiaceae bacterium]
MNRYYLPAGDWKNHTLALTGDEAKHCTRVMRAREGDTIEIFDGAGKSAVCTIQAISRDLVQCQVLDQKIHPPAKHPITLYQAIPKGGNMELIVQKAVELGVHAIQPLITAHTVARPESVAKKQLKWQRIALEACKQCGQNHLPEVRPAVHLPIGLDTLPSYGTRLIAALDPQAVHLKSQLAITPAQGHIALLIGPEGDFSPEEYQAAYSSGFLPISFGPIIMRVETATLYGLSILQHELSALSLAE